MQRLEPLASDEVSTLYERKKELQTQLVERALARTKQPVAHSFRLAVRAYADKREMLRRPATEHGLITVAGQGEETVRKFTKALRQTFPAGPLFERARKNAETFTKTNEQYASYRTLKAKFGDQSRLYFELVDNGKLSSDQKRIINVLSIRQYTNINYMQGTAKDKYERTVKIGKVLQKEKLMKDLNFFNTDPKRAHVTKNKSERQLLVLSTHPYDIIRMSAGRRWNSCARPGKQAGDYLLDQRMTPDWTIAYLIRETDPHIHNPLGRSFVAYNQPNATMGKWGRYNAFYFNDKTSLAIREDDFLHTVDMIADDLNANPA